jgi:hypothetical protein
MVQPAPSWTMPARVMRAPVPASGYRRQTGQREDALHGATMPGSREAHRGGPWM